MKIHEYQAKAILRGFKIESPRGMACFSADEAAAAAEKLAAGGRSRRRFMRVAAARAAASRWRTQSLKCGGWRGKYWA